MVHNCRDVSVRKTKKEVPIFRSLQRTEERRFGKGRLKLLTVEQEAVDGNVVLDQQLREAVSAPEKRIGSAKEFALGFF